MMKPQIIALYLPQFHPCPENDEWWGKGFTEWTNVGRAKPLFKGHDQPRVPADLGYYDLRLPIVREQQAELAREAGVTAFCYWHYWFGNGRRLLNDVFDEVLESGHPDFPFCLGWANHSWYAKSWNKTVQNLMLMEQTYPGIEDERMHFAFLLKAFSDHRYYKVDGKPFLHIFDPFTLPKIYLEHLRQWAKDAGYPDLYVVANSHDVNISPDKFRDMGYDAVSYGRITAMWSVEYKSKGRVGKLISRVSRILKQFLTGRPRGLRDYRKDCHLFITDEDKRIDVVPQIVPQWDHSPRSGDQAATIYHHATPEAFKEHVSDAMEAIREKPEEYQILLLKSWNEWGEGNYMEPDLSHGKGFIKVLGEMVHNYSSYF
jgi:hypothetical protein